MKLHSPVPKDQPSLATTGSSGNTGSLSRKFSVETPCLRIVYFHLTNRRPWPACLNTFFCRAEWNTTWSVCSIFVSNWLYALVKYVNNWLQHCSSLSNCAMSLRNTDSLCQNCHHCNITLFHKAVVVSDTLHVVTILLCSFMLYTCVQLFKHLISHTLSSLNASEK